MDTKSCPRCSIIKEASEFDRRSNKPHLLKSYCRKCENLAQKERYRNNAEARKAYQKSYYEHNKEDIKRQTREARAAMSEEERQAYCDYLRAWRDSNPERVKDYRRGTRAKRAKAFVEHVPFEAIWNRDHGVCQLCDKEIDLNLKFPDWGSATLDHTFPLSKGGTHEMANIQLAHWYCNWQKRATILERQ